jgi:hypothetical protein
LFCRPWPPSSCTSVRPSLNFLHHILTQLSLITLSPYTQHNWRWISAGLLREENKSQPVPHSWREQRW